ncbi:MAG: hypothetical protein V4724_00375 [Pseudomonadota bacterium]
MDNKQCGCASCRNAAAGGFEVLEFGAAQSSPFSEAEEVELAMELLSVASEAELDQFLGKMFKGVWKGIKKVGSVVGKIARPLGGVLKGIAKKALPFVGGALGSLIPIPGVGTALGSALGGALGNALELEFEGMEYEQQEFEMARRFVRIAGTAAQLAGDGDGSAQSVRQALLTALRRHAPHFAATSPSASGEFGETGELNEAQGEAYAGPWRRRRAGRIEVLGLR